MKHDNYEEALCKLYELTALLYGGYYEPKSERDKQLGDELHKVWTMHSYSPETIKIFEFISDPQNKHLFTTEKALEAFKHVKIKED